MAMDATAALRNLRALTTCRCGPEWTTRGRHALNAVCSFADEVEALARVKEDVEMYERWAEASPVRVFECSCGLRYQVRVADHEIGEAVPAEKSSAPDVDQIKRWQGMERRAREMIDRSLSVSRIEAAAVILGEGPGK